MKQMDAGRLVMRYALFLLKLVIASEKRISIICTVGYTKNIKTHCRIRVDCPNNEKGDNNYLVSGSICK